MHAAFAGRALSWVLCLGRGEGQQRALRSLRMGTGTGARPQCAAARLRQVIAVVVICRVRVAVDGCFLRRGYKF